MLKIWRPFKQRGDQEKTFGVSVLHLTKWDILCHSHHVTALV